MIDYPEPSPEELADVIRQSPEPLTLFAHVLLTFPDERREEIAREIGMRCSEVLLVHAKRINEEIEREKSCPTNSSKDS